MEEAGSTVPPNISARLHGVASHKTVLVRRHQQNLKPLFIYYNAATKTVTSKLYTIYKYILLKHTDTQQKDWTLVLSLSRT